MEENLESMGSFFTIAFIIALIFGILQIILFFKLWIMTNDIRKIRNKFLGVSEDISQPVSKESTSDKSIRIISVLFTIVSLLGVAFMPMWTLLSVLMLDVILLIYAFTRR